MVSIKRDGVKHIENPDQAVISFKDYKSLWPYRYRIRLLQSLYILVFKYDLEILDFRPSYPSPMVLATHETEEII